MNGGIIMNNGEVGQRIRSLRKQRGYSVDELSQKTDISSKFLYEIEEGKKGFSAWVLQSIAKELEVSCEYIMTGTSSSVAKREEVMSIVSSFNDNQVDCIISILKSVCEINRVSR